MREQDLCRDLRCLIKGLISVLVSPDSHSVSMSLALSLFVPTCSTVRPLPSLSCGDPVHQRGFTAGASQPDLVPTLLSSSLVTAERERERERERED